MRYPTLFSPAHVGGVRLANRAVMLPMGLRFTHRGTITPDDIAFYRARAAGGIGLIIVGGTLAHPSSVNRTRGQREAFRAANIQAFARLARAVHEYGTPIFGQLLHVGAEWLADTEFAPVGPSAVARTPAHPVPHALSEKEIRSIVAGFVRSAANLQAAGFDGLELHAGHGYLLGQFLSPERNLRNDRYGGSASARLRLAVEIADGIRSRCGDSFPVGIRLSAVEESPGGITIEDSAETARLVAASQLFSYISVSVGVNGSYVKDMSFPRASFSGLARVLRQASGLPVIASQRITRPEDAEALLERGDADLVGMARQLIADPAWVNKARQGDADRILPCVGCLQDCRLNPGGVTCVHNPVSGRERTLGVLVRTNRPRRVAVVGGGPAGLEAARVCAERGHRVLLYERHEQLGGQVALAARAPNRSELAGVVAYRVAELTRLGVELRVGVAASPDLVIADHPDAVVVATGAEPAPPTFDIAVDAHVIDVWSLLQGEEDEFLDGKRVTVVDDGHGRWETYNAAEYLVAAGARVTVVTAAHTIGAGVPPESLPPLLGRLAAAGVELHVLRRVKAVDSHALWTTDAFPCTGGTAQPIPTDLAVVAGPARPVDQLSVQLSQRLPVVFTAGDCVSPRRISHAVLEGHRVARKL